MSAAPAKFTFDLDLARGRRRTRIIAEDELDALLDQTRREGYEQGLASGRSSVEASSADRLSAAAAALADNSAAMVEALDARQRRNLAQAVHLATATARKLAAHLMARQPEAELAALLGECMGSLDHAPHLVVRCHPDLCEAMRAAAEQRMASAGFAGRLVVMGDPEIGLGDGRLEWVDGGLVRDLDAISAEIDARIAAYLSARGATDKQGA